MSNTNWRLIGTAPADVWILTFASWSDVPIGVSRYQVRINTIERVERDTITAKGRRLVIAFEDVPEREWEGAHYEPTHWMPLPEPPVDEDTP